MSNTPVSSEAIGLCGLFVLFYNYGSNGSDLYDLIYKLLEKLSQ